MADEKKPVVALYDDATTALTMIEQLEDAGVPRQFLSIMGFDLRAIAQTFSGDDRVGHLTRLGIPKIEADLYVENVRRGGTLIIARVSDAQVDGVISVLEQYTSVDIAQRGTVDRQSGWSAQERTAADLAEASVREQPARHAPMDSPDTSDSLSAGALDLRDLDSGEQHIPIVEEEIQIGKRAVNRGGVRVRSYIVETRVQEQVVLRDETPGKKALFRFSRKESRPWKEPPHLSTIRLELADRGWLSNPYPEEAGAGGKSCPARLSSTS